MVALDRVRRNDIKRKEEEEEAIDCLKGCFF